MNFGEALDQLRLGARVYRQGWNGRGMWLAIEDTSRWPDSKMRPFIYMRTADGTLVPWVASQTDLLAEDWLIRVERDDAAAQDVTVPEWERELLAKQGSYSTPATPVTEVHVYLDGQKIYDAMQPHAQRYRRNNGGLV